MASVFANLLSSTIADSAGIDILSYGTYGSDPVANSAKLQQAMNDAGPAGKIIFPGNPSGYLIEPGQLVVTHPNQYWEGQPRDGYAVALRANSGTGYMLAAKPAGFVYRGLGLIGNGGVNGESATMDGIDIYGDVNANGDALLTGTIQGVKQAIKNRARNVDASGLLVSNCQKGTQLDGPDPLYHTGPTVDSGQHDPPLTLPQHRAFCR